jgi:hypothetical protein
MGIKAKIDTGKSTKVAKKTGRRQTKKVVEEEKVDPYRFIRREGDSIFLKKEVIEQFDKFGADIKAVDNELMLFELKKENYELQVETMKQKIELINRDKRDVETAIFHKKTEKKNIRTLQGEHRFKICKELGDGTTSFGYDEDTLEVKVQKT